MAHLNHSFLRDLIFLGDESEEEEGEGEGDKGKCVCDCVIVCDVESYTMVL